MVFKLKKVMEALGPSAALALAAWLLQLLEQRHAAAHTRYRALVEAFRHGAEGMRRDPAMDDIGICRQRVMPMLRATHIGMAAASLLLLSLMISTLDAVFKADWLKLFGAPANMLRLLLLIPAAILVIMENMTNKKRLAAEPTGLGGVNTQRQTGPAPRIPERRSRQRSSGQLQPHGA